MKVKIRYSNQLYHTNSYPHLNYAECKAIEKNEADSNTVPTVYWDKEQLKAVQYYPGNFYPSVINVRIGDIVHIDSCYFKVTEVGLQWLNNVIYKKNRDVVYY